MSMIYVDSAATRRRMLAFGGVATGSRDSPGATTWVPAGRVA